MSNTVIKVSDISKRYRIGVRQERKTFAGQLASVLLYPIYNLKRIVRMSRFDNELDPTIFWALKDINFEVKRGDVLGIIGKNGAGKSTLLKILSRITQPTTGDVRIKGRVSALLEVGTGFHPELTGRENVYMNGTILGMTKREIDRKFDEIIDFAGIEKHLDTPVKFYSSGMSVRLGFSVAAHLEPEILIIDEVLAVGDADFQKKCLGKMDEVSKGGRTVLFVSHNMTAIRSLCKNSLLLQAGKIVMIDSSDKAIDTYLNSSYNSKTNIQINKFSEDGTVELVNAGFIGKNEYDKINIFEENPFTVRFNCYHENTQVFHVNIFFKDGSNTVLFYISSKSKIINKGNYEVKFFIPAYFLNDIIYTLDIMVVGENQTNSIYFKDAMQFEGFEPYRAGAWLGKAPGFIRTKNLITTTEPISC